MCLLTDATKGCNYWMVVNSNGDIEQVTHYYPYGGVIGDISTNENVQKYKLFHYIPREQARSEGPRSHQKEIDNLLARRRAFRRGVELDRTFGLDNYDIHARQYFAMAPMWDRIDPLAEKYYGISPYAYCGGDPVNKGDYNGMEVIADSLSQIAIINSLPQEERHLVSFNSDGSASVQLSDNSSEILQTFNALVSSSNIYEIKVSPVDMNGKAFSNDPNDYYYGYTQTPIDPDYPSTDGKIHIFISSLLSEVDQALNYGHEALSHGYFFEIGKPYGHDPYLEGTEVFNEELNCTEFVFIWKDRNIELINQIKKITELIKQNIKSE